MSLRSAPDLRGGCRRPMSFDLAEDGVHECHAAFAKASTREIDRGAHGCIVGNTVEIAELICSNAQDVAKCSADAGSWIRKCSCKSSVDRASISEHSGGDLMCQTSVGFGEALQSRRDGILEPLARSHGAEDVERCSPRVLHLNVQRTQSSNPLVGLEGTATSRRGIRPAR
jgi:hypothetical protein